MLYTNERFYMYLTWNRLYISIKESFDLLKKNFIVFFVIGSLFALAIYLLSDFISGRALLIEQALYHYTNNYFYLKVLSDLFLQSIKLTPWCIGVALGIIFLQNYLTKRSNKWLLFEAMRAGISMYGSFVLLVIFFLIILAPLSLILAFSGRFFINYFDAREILYSTAVLLMLGLCAKSIFLIPAACIKKLWPLQAIRESWRLSRNALFKLLIIQLIGLKLLSTIFWMLKKTPYLVFKLASGVLGITLINLVLLWLITTYNLLQKKDIQTM